MNIKKHIKNYKWLYTLTEDGKVINRDGKILKTQISKCGYVVVSLSKNGKQKGFTIHRLLANHFIKGRTAKKNQVNHINGIKTDNRLENLEWVSASANIIHSFKNGMSKIVNGECHWFSKPIICTNTITNEILEFGSMTMAAAHFQITPATICQNIRLNRISRQKIQFNYKINKDAA